MTTVTANPGTVATFGLTITNTGSVSDSYDLSSNVGSGAYAAAAPFAFTTLGALPSGYSLAFYRDNGTTCAPAQRGAQLTNTGVIAPAGTVNVCALVTIPNGASVATTQLFFRALSPTTFSGSFTLSSGDVKNDALTINTFRTISITPNNSGQIFPGGSVQYCHTVTNGGNVNESLTVTQTAQSLFTAGAAGWAQFASVYADTNQNCVLDGVENATPLTLTVVNAQVYTPGTSTRFIVVVQAPLAASSGQTNANLFTLSSVSGATGNLAATDTTTVVVGQVQLVKEQALDPSATCATAMNLAGVGALTYAQTQITTGALPGRCIVYKVTATNTGTQSVTNVTVNDVAPPNTTLNGAHFCNTTLQPACTVGGTAPAVSSTITPLAAGASSVLFFRVQINP